MRRRTREPSTCTGAAALVVASCLTCACLACAPGTVAGQQTPGGPTVSRPDSLNSLVLSRVRGGLVAGADTVVADTVGGDSLATGPDSVGAAASDTVAAGGGRTQRVAPAQLRTGADPIMRALLDLPGFNSAAYRGDRADFDAAERRLVLWGTAESRAFFSGRGVRLEADTSITYEDRDGRLITTGPTDLISDESDPLRSEMLIYDLQQARGTAVNAETTYTEGAQWIVRGNLDSIEENVLFGSSARFTTCDLPEPHSYFQARQLKVIGGQVLVARSVRMYVDDVPILWLPFIAQNLGRGRASGILTPVFSINDVVRSSSGYSRRISNIGYYWAMSDYSDLTVAMDWYSGNYIALQGGVRYRWADQFLNGSFNGKQFWGSSRNEVAFDTRHSWDLSERTSLRVSGRYVTTEAFVRQNSLDPRESVGTVDSDADFTRRFDWGRLTLGASRKQYLNEDEREEYTLPSASLALSTLTLFGAPTETASWYNNLSVGGSMSFDRRIEDRAIQPDSAFAFAQASETLTEGSVSGSVSLGDLSFTTNVRANESVFEDVPGRFFEPGEEPTPGLPVGDFRAGSVNLTAGLSYRVSLIGSTTLTPNINLERSLVRVDSIPEALNYVEGPTRMRSGVRLQTDIYGFYPGFGGFEAIRHKISPSIGWSYSPEVTPTVLQERVFGPTASRTQNVFTVGLNQTWEARVSEEVADAASGAAAVGLTADSTGIVVAPDGAAPVQPIAPADPAVPAAPVTPAPPLPGAPDAEGLTRLPPARTIELLGLNTNAVTYDVIQADSTGNFIDGFTTMALTNRVSSAYLQGLDLSFTHDLFNDSERAEGGDRKFAPHLSQLSFNFSLSDESGLVRALGRLLGMDSDDEPAMAQAQTQAAAVPADTLQTDPLDQVAGFDPDQVIPGRGSDDFSRDVEGWEANLRYSLNRPRGSEQGSALRAQMLSSQIAFSPSENWTVDWSTSYDIERKQFNDHRVNLRRNLHEWEARFGFVQTANGNWSFQFEVALRASQDLRFDYQQRSLEFDRAGL